jgi:hypothetical protein
MEQTWDLGGCADLSRATTPLKEMSAAWVNAPACLKTTLKPRLTEALDEMGGWSCYCKSQAEARSAAQGAKSVLEGLADLGGKKAAQEAVENSNAKESKFKDTCSG